MRIALATLAAVTLAVASLTVPNALTALAAVGVASWAAYGALATE